MNIIMKNYLSLSNLSEPVARIISACSCKSKAKQVSKEMPFVVLNSDADCGFYVRRLIKEISRFDLLEQPKVLRKKSLKGIETGDLIVFGDTQGTVNYDYRVETEAAKLDHLDGRKFKVYDLINDFDKVIKRLKRFAEENDGEEYLLVKENKKCKCEENVSEININLNVHNRIPKSVTHVAILRKEINEEKVTIFDNWVKVGYNQYDIYVDLFGKEFIYVSGSKFYVKEDRFGRKYLTK
jgi:hypothetical protein